MLERLDRQLGQGSLEVAHLATVDGVAGCDGGCGVQVAELGVTTWLMMKWLVTSLKVVALHLCCASKAFL